MHLSSRQKDAVEYIGSPALVVAGAGSGKTRTLTSKIAHLVSNGYDPE
ncbi:MAG: UvrD-helicase domain-containing protein, partial [Proteobacteria bacterium]|nr:UvrD-helicase domain-containing protein [Pseudomonadota bacterium]